MKMMSAWLRAICLGAAMAFAAASGAGAERRHRAAVPGRAVLAQAVAEQLAARAGLRHRDRQIRSHLGGASAGFAHSARTRGRAEPAGSRCCVAAPPVLVFDQSGNLIRHWGGPGQGYQWPASEHGIFVDDNDFVWLAGNGKKDGQLLKFTMDGKFVLQIGKQGQGNDSNSTERLGLAGRRRGGCGCEGGVRCRRLRQPPRGRVRYRDRRLQAPLGRLRQEAERREDAAL